MKKYFKKSLALLLAATSFTFLCTTLGTSNVLTYADTKVESEVKNETEQKQASEETTVESDTEQDAEETAVGSDTEQDAEEATAKDDAEQSPEKTATESDSEQRQDIEIVTSKFFPSEKFVHYKGTSFYLFEDLLKPENQDPKYKSMSKEKLDKIYKNAKEKIHSSLGLTYPDTLRTPIYIDYFGRSVFNYKDNYILIRYNCQKIEETLSHEMTHALLHHLLGDERYLDLTFEAKGIDEGLAT